MAEYYPRKNMLEFESEVTEEESKAEDSYLTILKDVCSHTLPIIAGGTLAVVSSFGNAVIIASISDDAVKVIGYVSSIKNVLIYPARSVFFSLQPLIGDAYQKKDFATAGKYWKYSVLLGLELGLILCLPLMNIDSFLRLTHQNKELSTVTGEYFRYFAAAIPANMMIEITNELFITTGNESLIIPSSFLRFSLELGMNAFFINYLKMGIHGWALSSLIQPIIYSIILMSYIALSNKFKNLHLFRFNNSNENLMQLLNELYHFQKKIMVLGFPVCVQTFGGFGAYFSEVLMLGSMNVNGMIAFNTSNQWSNWTLNIHTSLATSTSVLISKKLANKELLNAKKVGEIAISASGLISIISLIIMTFAYKPMTEVLLNPDNDKDKILHYAKIIMPIIGVSTLGFGIKFIASGAMRGYKDTSTPMLIDVVGTLAGLGLSATLGFATNMEAIGVATGDAFGLMLAGMLLMYFFSMKNSKKMDYRFFSYNPLNASSEDNKETNTILDGESREVQLI